MKKYQIKVLKQSIKDLDDLAAYITESCNAPLTAKRYTEGILAEIRSLRNYAESIQFSTRESILLKFGTNIRRINYKKHAILFTVQRNTIVIHRILVGSLIK